ncbi:MAG: hypothetical protein KatS3mg078_1570 [Deltaproteobacteria bacterium]|nr:MAG: hypothetical protein KatS3mg078_1570 [Deltaproteobacteria bacterium]
MFLESLLSSLKHCFENLPIPAFKFDTGGIIRFCNSRFEALFGYNSQEVIGKHVSSFGIRLDNADDINQLFTGFSLRSFPGEFVTKDGKALICECLCIPVLDDEGKSVGILSLVREIDPQQKVLDREARQLELFKKALEHAGEALFITDVYGSIEWVNPAFTSITGYTFEEAVGQNPRILKSGVHPREFYEQFWNHILSGNVWKGVFVNRRKNGEIYYDERTIAPVFDTKGRITHFVAIGKDITRRIQVEESLKAYSAHLEVRNRILSFLLEKRDLNELLVCILEEALTLTGVEFGGIHFVEDGKVVLKVWRGISDEFRSHVLFYPVDDIPFWMKEERIVHERLSEDGVTPEFAKQEGIQSWACIPFVLPTGEFVGALMLGSRKYGVFDEEKVDVLRGVKPLLSHAIWHAKVYSESQRRLLRLEVLRNIDRAIIQQLDLKDVVNVVLSGVPKDLGADAVALSLFDKTKTQLYTFSMRLPNGTVIDKEAFRLSEGLLYWFLEEKKPVIIYDLSTDPRMQMYRDIIHRWKLVSYLGVPLVSKNRTIGVLHLFTVRPKVFESEDIEFFTTLAGQTAIALENVRMYQEIYRKSRVLEELLNVQSTFSTVPVRDLPQVILNTARASLQVEKADFYIYDKSTNTLRLAACSGFSTNRLEACLSEQASIVKLGEGVIGRAALERRATYIGDIESEPGWRGFSLDSLESIRSAYILPLEVFEELMGVVVLFSSKVNGFSEFEMELANLFSHYMAVGMRMALLIDELRETNKLLRQAQETLIGQERLKALGQMASGIVHDINNALVPVMLSADMLAKYTDETIKKVASGLKRTAEDMARTVERLRFFYAPRLKEEKIEPVDLNETVHEVLESTRPRWYDIPQREGITIETVLELDDTLPVISGIGSEIREALINILFNAVDAIAYKGEKTGFITIKTYKTQSRLVLEVTDSGIGMDEETKRRVFEPFFTTKGKHGSGLGLSMVYGIMQRHGGTVEIESEPGRGTTVRLIFPIKLPSNGEVKRKEPNPLIVIPPLRVLLVDDDIGVRSVIRETLKGFGHSIEEASSGEEALEKFREALAQSSPYQLVITDLGMPGIGGYELVRQVRSIEPTIPVIVLTGWGGDMEVEYADRVLEKPVDLQKLIDTIALVISLKSAR